jgi:NitT/TauT family transport system substrate-binding protein
MAGRTTVGPKMVSGRSGLSRRQFLRSAAMLGVSATGLALLNGCAGSPTAPGVATETLETKTIRLSPTICAAPLHLADVFLHQEGITKVEYVDREVESFAETLVAGHADIGAGIFGQLITAVDADKPLTMLAGLHTGCFVLFGTEGVNSLGDLKGKMVGTMAEAERTFLSSLLAYVGVNPITDITWITQPWSDMQQRFRDRTIDALAAFPPYVQELQAQKIGHVIVNSGSDKPWSQYYCCMLAARQEFVQQNPVATKRALRAILKATDVAARNPALVAKTITSIGFTDNYQYTLQATRDLPYNHWREYDPEDTLRFYALRLREAGMIKSSPDEIIAKGTDWRFLNELKQELPAPAASVRNDGLLCHPGQRG